APAFLAPALGHGEQLPAAAAGAAPQLAFAFTRLRRGRRRGRGRLRRLLGLLRAGLHPLAAQTDLAVGRIDAQDAHLDLVANLDHLFRALDLVVGQFRDMQQALQPRLQFDEHAEVGQLRDLALLDVAGVVAAGDVAFPRVVGHLLQAQGDTLALLVHVEDDALDLLALADHLTGVADLAHPAHVADVQEAVDPLLNLDKSAVVGQVADDPGDLCARRVALGDLVPGVGLHLLDAQRDFLLFLVDVQDLHLDLVADRDQLAGVIDALGPAHLADVHQALDARLQLDEGAIAHDVDDLAC